MRLLDHIGCLAAIIALTTVATPASAQGVTDYLGLPGRIAFDGQSYELAWSSQPNAGYAKHEYIPAGQVPETYESMIMVEVLAADIAPLAMATAQVEILNERKATDPLVNMELMQNDQTGEVLLDFLLSSRDDAGDYIIEWNAYRYAAIETPDGAPAGLLFAISHRAYGDDAEAFLKGLKDRRPGQIQALAAAPLPDL
ncbi:hypothetical protein [Pseudotabrizicola sp. 4114]|uniref:hypothetical protein n=1 Tax=Pseudotabrizicola sp. 4114 TaxID=2817731 RepID=UPI00285BF17E|nr:hypothetical protein [Pseudorhodobacter sp. 4114]